jgi:hypothetical protein
MSPFGADRPLLWRSPAWELQVVWWQLCASMVISDGFRFSQWSSARAWMLAAQHYVYMQQHGHRKAPL